MKIGILSFAHVHAAGFAQCVTSLPDVELAAIADDDVERGTAAIEKFGGDYYHDYHDLLARDDIEAVIITSPNAHHREMTIAAAQAKKHVFCEKPIATKRADALEMLDACRKQNVKFQTAFPMRFNAPSIRLREMVHEGAIGKPLAVTATNPGQMPPGWFSDPELAGGGAVMDHTVHVADMLRWIFDQDVVSVYAEVDTRLNPGAAVDDVAMLMLKLADGTPVSLDPSWSRPKSWPTWGGVTMDVIGERGVLSLDAFNQTIEVVANHEPGYAKISWAEGGNLELVRSFVDAVRNDTEPVVTGEDGLHAMEVALCAYESAKRREPVACPEGLIE